MADERELKGHDVKKLAFVVSQLGDDLEDIVSGLESGTLTYEAASNAVATQLRWVLGQLQTSLKD